MHLCRNLKWGSDEISVAVKVDGQCLMCFPEICEKIVLDHSYELLTKKLTNLKIQLIDGSDILKETTHIHDTPSQTCQLIRYQDLLAVLKHFNYKVPESFERAITSLENEVQCTYNMKLRNDFSSQLSVYVYGLHNMLIMYILGCGFPVSSVVMLLMVYVTQAYQAELKNDMQKSQVSSSPGEEYSGTNNSYHMDAIQQSCYLIFYC